MFFDGTESDRIGLPADIYLDDRMLVCRLGRGTVFASVSGVVLEMLEISRAHLTSTNDFIEGTGDQTIS